MWLDPWNTASTLHLSLFLWLTSETAILPNYHKPPWIQVSHLQGARNKALRRRMRQSSRQKLTATVEKLTSNVNPPPAKRAKPAAQAGSDSERTPVAYFFRFTNIFFASAMHTQWSIYSSHVWMFLEKCQCTCMTCCNWHNNWMLN